MVNVPLTKAARFVRDRITDEVQKTLLSARVSSLNITPDELRTKLEPHLHGLSNRQLERITLITLYRKLQKDLREPSSNFNLVLYTFGRDIFPVLLKCSEEFKQLANTLTEHELDYCWSILDRSLLTPAGLRKFNTNPPLPESGWSSDLDSIQQATGINFNTLTNMSANGIETAVEKAKLELRVRFNLQKLNQQRCFCPKICGHWGRQFSTLYQQGCDAKLEQWSMLSSNLEDALAKIKRLQSIYENWQFNHSFHPIAQNWRDQTQALAEQRNPIATPAEWNVLYERVTATAKALDLFSSYAKRFSNQEYNTVIHYWRDQIYNLNATAPQASKQDWDELTRRIDLSFLTVTGFCQYERGSRTTQQHYRAYALSQPEAHNLNDLCQLVTEKTGLGCRLHKGSFFICVLDTLHHASQDHGVENYLAPLLKSAQGLKACLDRGNYNDPTQSSSSFWNSSAGKTDRGRILQAVKAFATRPARQLTHAEAAQAARHNLQALRA